MTQSPGGTLPRLFAIQFLSWSAMFCVWIYGLPVIAAVLRLGVEAAVPAVGLCFSGYALASALLGFAHPWLFARASAGVVHGLALLVGSVGLVLLATATSAIWLVPAFGALAICWSAMGAVPYAAAAATARPGRGGATLRRFGFSTVLPQIATTLGLAALVSRVGMPGSAVMLIGAGELGLAGLLTLWWRKWIIIPSQEW